MKNNDAGKNADYEQIQVECYSGYKSNERPIAFTFQNRRREISEIVDRWYEGGVKPDDPVINYFKIKTNDGTIFILRYLANSDNWLIRI
jgi:hypothetical protein